MRASFDARARGRTPRPKVARGASIPAPTGGWDALTPLSNMPPDRAVKLENWFPQPGYVEIRRGYSRHTDTQTGEPVETLMSYQGPTSIFLFAASDDTIFDVSVSGLATPAVTGLSNARWQHTNFATTGGNFLWCCNGSDEPRYFDGVAWSTASITGVGGSDMVHVVAYKSRLWTVLRDSTKAAYLPLDSIQGAATEFDVGPEFTLGGYLQAIGTWSTDNNDGPVNYIVFISNYGQVVIYDIPDPNAPDGITLKAKANIGAPLGRRCFTKVGADLGVICLDGVLPISQAISYDRAALLKIAITGLIQPVVNQSARAYGENFGWQLIGYPRGQMAILNVPVQEGARQEQYVMNTVTGAWCRFLGQNANCWEIWDNRPFFGGNDGSVYEADSAPSDAASRIDADMKTAFNYFGSRGNLKRWTEARPLLTTNGIITPAMALDVDFRDDAVLSTPNSFTGSAAKWDEAIWDVSFWPIEDRVEASWQTVAGLGYCASVRMKVSIGEGAVASAAWGQAQWGISAWGAAGGEAVTLQVNGFDLLLEDGAYI